MGNQKPGDSGYWAPPGALAPNGASGFNGYTYSDPEEFGADKYGIPKVAIGQFPTMARYLLKGSQDASQSALKGFESGFRARAHGIAAGFDTQQNALSGEVASQGYSPDLVRRMLAGGQASSQAQIGQARAEADQGFQMHLAELQKNTGVELAGLTRDQLNFELQAYLAKKARTAGQQAGQMQLLGSALGAGATAFGGPAAGATTKYVSSGGGKIF